MNELVILVFDMYVFFHDIILPIFVINILFVEYINGKCKIMQDMYRYTVYK